AETLAKAGHDLLYVGCGGEFQRCCIPMNAQGLTSSSPLSQRQSVCRRCKDLRNLIVTQFGFRATDIAAVLDQGDRAAAAEIVAGASRENYLRLEHAGLPAGRIALYEYLLQYKKLSLNHSSEEWEDYLAALENTLLSIYAVKRLLDQERFDAVIVYNALYSVNRAACLYCEQNGMRSVFLHAGGNLANRLQTLMVSHGHTFRFFQEMKERWPQFAGRPCPAQVAQQVTNHFIELIDGQHFLAYSAAKEGASDSIRQKYGVPLDARLLVATMSSYDERLAAESIGVLANPPGLVFERQIDWIRALVEHVRGRPDLFLLIRVHPREFPNKREATKSEHASLLEECFERLPANARVNWPADNLSLYDLAEETDVFLNAWSSVGKEMSLLGIPVVIYSRDLVLYPPELNFVADDRDGYFRKIEEALAAGWSLDRVKMMYRWYALEFDYALVDISSGFARREGRPRTLGSRIANRLRRLRDPYHIERAELRARAPALAETEAAKIISVIAGGQASPIATAVPGATDSAALEEEHRTILHELGRLASVLGAAERGGNRMGRLSARLAQISRETAGTS
ncbi:MAG TPA: hypothetical protein VF523_04295, partial [Burkholderiales bacterium]